MLLRLLGLISLVNPANKAWYNIHAINQIMGVNTSKSLLLNTLNVLDMFQEFSSYPIKIPKRQLSQGTDYTLYSHHSML